MKKRLRKKSKRLMCSHQHEGEDGDYYWAYGSCVFSNGDRECSLCKAYSVSMQHRRYFHADRKYYKKHLRKYFGD